MRDLVSIPYWDRPRVIEKYYGTRCAGCGHARIYHKEISEGITGECKKADSGFGSSMGRPYTFHCACKQFGEVG